MRNRFLANLIFASTILIGITALNACAFMEPNWFKYIKNANAACKAGDFKSTDEWLNKARTEAEKYHMDPPHYGVLPYDSTTFSGSLATLATMYERKGKFVEAENLFREAMKIKPESNYGWGLADLFMKQKRYKDAEPLLLDNLQIQERLFKPKMMALFIGII